MAEQLRTIILLSMTYGKSQTAECTSICTASSVALMLRSSTSPSGPLYSYSSLAVCNHLPSWNILFLICNASADPQLISSIRNSGLLVPNIRQLSSSRSSTPSSSGGTPRSHRSQTHSYQDTETGEGQGEIQLLARRILDFVDGDGEVMLPPSATPSHVQPGSSIGTSSIVSGRDHEELRKSVREAFSSGSHGH
jgi:vacuolar protein 8